MCDLLNISAFSSYTHNFEHKRWKQTSTHILWWLIAQSNDKPEAYDTKALDNVNFAVVVAFESICISPPTETNEDKFAADEGYSAQIFGQIAGEYGLPNSWGSSFVNNGSQIHARRSDVR